MAKTRLELLEEEAENLTEVIRHQFIERDICMYMDDPQSMQEVVEEIRVFQRRLEAIKHLLKLERDKADGRDSHDFQCAIFINPAHR